MATQATERRKAQNRGSNQPWWEIEAEEKPKQKTLDECMEGNK